ncbi:MAG: hypothetical protein HY301_15265 [Verrucomicrobia bacterium]|nr:hypothetical protein [Verrucomicrobiota bacterium]
MDKLTVTAASRVTAADLATARLGSRFGRMDLFSQLALLAVESLGINFDSLARDRVAICLAAATSSLATDVEFWKGRDAAGGLSPTLFTYTLPSAAIGELAIRHRLTGPNLCLVGGDALLLAEAADLIRRGEADACVCVSGDVVSAALAELIRVPATAGASALFLQRGGEGPHVLRENDRDIASWCAVISGAKNLG